MAGDEEMAWEGQEVADLPGGGEGLCRHAQAVPSAHACIARAGSSETLWTARKQEHLFVHARYGLIA